MVSSIIDIHKLRRITAASFVERLPEHFPVHQTEFSFPNHFLYFHIAGRRTVILDRKPVDLSAGSVCFFFADTQYTALRPEEKYVARNIQFSTSPEDAYGLSRSLVPEHLAMPEFAQLDPVSSIARLFGRIVRSANSSSERHHLLASILLSELLWEIGVVPKPHESDSLRRINEAVAHIEDNLSRPVSLEECASLTGMSVSAFTLRFRRHIGMSMKQFHLSARMRVADSIMTNDPRITNQELAAILGFSDEAHFAKTYRRLRGEAPGQRRRSVLRGTTPRPRGEGNPSPQ